MLSAVVLEPPSPELSIPEEIENAPTLGDNPLLDSEQWEPFILSPDQTEIEIEVTVDSTATANVTLTLNSDGQRVTDWGEVTRQGNRLIVNVKVEQRPDGLLTPAFYSATHSYDLGMLEPGEYTFEFMSSGETVETEQFTVGDNPLLDSEQWEPFILSPDQTEIEIEVTVDSTATANVRLTFNTGGYRVTDWGEVTHQGNRLTANVQVERWTGDTTLALTYASNSYDLGTLEPGEYTFEFMSSGESVETVQFMVGDDLFQSIDSPDVFMSAVGGAAMGGTANDAFFFTGADANINWTIDTTNANDAVKYDLLVYNVNTGQEVLDLGVLQTISHSPASLTSAARYQVFVRSTFGTPQPSEWSSPVYFTLTGAEAPPATPQFNGLNGEMPPSVTWTATVNAASYELLIYNVAAGQQVLNQAGIAATEFSPTALLASGDEYQAFVRSTSASGENSAWSAAFHFSGTGPSQIPPAPTFAPPRINWQDTGAASYDVLIYDTSIGAEVLHETGLTNTTFGLPSEVSLPGDYQAFIRARDANGQYGVWSSPLNFHYEIILAIPEPLFPLVPKMPSNLPVIIPSNPAFTPEIPPNNPEIIPCNPAFIPSGEVNSGLETNNPCHYSVSDGVIEVNTYTNSQEYGTFPVDYEGESFVLSFDIEILERTTGDANIGLFSSSRQTNQGPPADPTIYVVYGGYEQGVGLRGHDANGDGFSLPVGDLFKSFDLNTVYHTEVTYDEITRIARLVVTSPDDPTFFFDDSVSIPAGLPALPHLGVSSVGSWITSGRFQKAQIDNLSFETGNLPPVLSLIGDQIAFWDSQPTTIEVDLSASDPDGDALTFTASVSGAPEVTVEVVGSTLFYTFPAWFSGNFEVTVTVSDGLLSDSETFSVTVTELHARDPQPLHFPVLSPIDDKITAWDNQPTTIEVDLSASDPDGDDLTFTATVSGAPDVTVEVVGSTLFYTFPAWFSGNFEVTVTVSDGQLSDSESFGVTVTEIHARDPIMLNPPVLSPIDDQITAWDNQPTTLEVDLSASDPDGDALTFTATVSGAPEVTVEVVGSTLFYTFPAWFSGNFEVTVTVSDGLLSDSESFMVNVRELHTTTQDSGLTGLLDSVFSERNLMDL